MKKKIEVLSKDQMSDGLLQAKGLTDGFSEDEINLLCEIAVPNAFNAEDLIVKEDDNSRDILIMVAGTGSVEMRLKPESKVTGKIDKIRQGEVFGEFSFIDGSRRSTNVRAVTNIKMLRLPYDKLNMLCGTNNRLGYKVMRNLAVLMSRRLRNTNFELRTHLYI